MCLCADGKDGLLSVISRVALDRTLPSMMHSKACTVLCCFVSTNDGCTAALRAGFALKAFRALQNYIADKDFAWLESLLMVLENMASRSAEGQKAMLRTTAPSGNLLDTLLELLQHPCAAVSTRAAATLRNVTLCSEAKAFFLARPGRLGSMVDVLGQAGQHSTRAAYAASALWGLVYQGEKVKAALRRHKELDKALAVAAKSCATTLAKDTTTTSEKKENLIGAVETLLALLRECR